MVEKSSVREAMRSLFGHKPYDFQFNAVAAQLDGQSVILRAPTGAGKTDVALAPTLLGRLLGVDFPRQMIYTVPMRVLATQFRDKTQELLAAGAESGAWPLPKPSLAVQNGERPEDPRFEEDLIFTTIDQALASYLNIPYGLPSRMGNFNAGALVAAHLVADEFHLFGADAALPTTVEMLRSFRDAAPFLLMTATCSDALFKFLARELKATPLEPSEAELGTMASQQKTRTYEMAGRPISAGAVLSRHTERSIAVCNTVERAQDLYEELCAHPPVGTTIKLLHSRFLREHRRGIENWSRRTFARGAEQQAAVNAILVATQVVEVGLDISCDVLHTELAPANAIVQRAGRCARYEGETGTVFVYDPPMRDNGEPNYAPYLEEPQLGAVKATPAALASLCGRPAGYRDELMFVEEAHRAGDEGLSRTIASRAPARRTDILDAIRNGDCSYTRKLIRESDSRTLLVLKDPERCGSPYSREGFSFQTGSLQGRIRTLLKEQAGAAGWTVKIPKERMIEGVEYGVVSYRWESIRDALEVRANPVLAVNPALVDYDGDVGFRFRPGTPCESPLLSRDIPDRPHASYDLTPYPRHIRGLYAAYQGAADRLRIATERVAGACRTDAEMIDRLVRACLALHDAGKLTSGWVGWATGWEQALGKLRPGEPLRELVSHTDYNSDSGRERLLSRTIKPPRPSHAAEGAWIGCRVIERLAGGRSDLSGPAVAAIARHHSPTILTSSAYRLDGRARATLSEALEVVGLTPVEDDELYAESVQGPAAQLAWESQGQLLLYFFLVRVLRQADQQSFEMLRRGLA